MSFLESSAALRKSSLETMVGRFGGGADKWLCLEGFEARGCMRSVSDRHKGSRAKGESR